MEVLGMLLVTALITTEVHSTRVYSCKGKPHGKLTNVTISNCDDTMPCILKRGTQSSVDMQFSPNNNTEKVQNRVFAEIFGVPFPFLGFDGTPACDHIFHANGTFAGCPLSANTVYVYKNNFDIHNFYPSVSPRVHWALQDASSLQSIICFEVPAEIQS